MKDTKINLCDTCKFEIPTCKSIIDNGDGKFGDGLGYDNICECKYYEDMKNKPALKETVIKED